MNANEKNTNAITAAIEHQKPHMIINGRIKLPEYNPEDISFGALINRAMLYFHPICHEVIPAPTAKDQETALITGYLVALHKVRVYNPILFMLECDTAKHQMLLQLKAKRDIENVNGAYGCLTFLSADTKFYCYSLKTLFICGYRAGLHITGQYDDCLFLEGDMLECSILSSLLLFQKKREDARRTEARIVATHYGVTNEDLRTMIFDKDTIDDKGNPTPSEGDIIHGSGSPTPIDMTVDPT